MLWIAVVLGLVEGLTEFLPVSSTGHLILVSELLGFHGERAAAFQVSIQVGAILAVVWEFRARLGRLVLELPRQAAARRFCGKILLAFAPSALLGMWLHDWLFAHLFNTRSVAWALVAGGVLILLVEYVHPRWRVHKSAEATWPQALGIGIAQCLALWPGFSRSAATILGGLGVGLDRHAATMFSFFLAIPTMFGAAAYSLYQNRLALGATDLLWLLLSSTISFLVAWLSIRWLLRWVAGHSFVPFAIYRIAVGAVILWAFRGAVPVS